MLHHIEGQRHEDKPDKVARCFKVKLDQRMKVLTTGSHFGRTGASDYIYN